MAIRQLSLQRQHHHRLPMQQAPASGAFRPTGDADEVPDVWEDDASRIHCVSVDLLHTGVLFASVGDRIHGVPLLDDRGGGGVFTLPTAHAGHVSALHYLPTAGTLASIGEGGNLVLHSFVGD